MKNELLCHYGIAWSKENKIEINAKESKFGKMKVASDRVQVKEDILKKWRMK